MNEPDQVPPVRAVIWDFGGVLVRTEDPSARRALERRAGLDPGALEAMVFRSEIGQAAALGQKTDDDVWAWVVAQLRLPASEQRAVAAAFFAGDRLDEKLAAFVRHLRARVRTGLLSNAFPSLRLALTDRFPIADAFDAIVISSEEGLLKPDPRIYQRILERLDVDPVEAVFIDDFEENCEAARRLGMRAVRFENAPQAVAAVQTILGPAPQA